MAIGVAGVAEAVGVGVGEFSRVAVSVDVLVTAGVLTVGIIICCVTSDVESVVGTPAALVERIVAVGFCTKPGKGIMRVAKPIMSSVTSAPSTNIGHNERDETLLSSG
jgi:hypothetical protein